MNTPSECTCCDPRVVAVALGRWCLGLMFLFFGIGKLSNVSGFAEGLAKQFEKTWLPSPLVSLFGHALPFLETVVGAFLLLGLFRNATLFVTGLLLLSLTFGQILLMQAQVVFSNTVYVFMAAALLFLERFDYWVVFPRPKRGQAQEASANPVPPSRAPSQT